MVIVGVWFEAFMATEGNAFFSGYRFNVFVAV
jgi:hypothetical protein